MNDGILDTIKKMLGIPIEETAFDADIIVDINSALMDLEQFNVGPVGGFSIKDNSAKWEDLFGDITNQEAAKSYIQLKTRLLFDPPSSSFVIEAMQRQIDEAAFRLIVQAEPPAT